MSNHDRQEDRQQEQALTSNPDSARPDAGNRPDETTIGSTKQKLKEDVRDAKHEAKTQVREKAEAGQHRLADEAGALSDAIDAAAANLDEHDRDGLARYARQMSSKLMAAASQLEGRSVDQLAEDAKRLARDNPALFMLGSVAVGFGLSRFFKASEKHDHNKSHQTTQRNDDFVSAPPVRRSDNGITTPYSTPAAPPRSNNGMDTL